MVRVEFTPEDLHMFTAKRRRALEEWCNQVPVLRFNCGHYDLNLIKAHFAELLSDTTGRVQIGKKFEKGMFMKSKCFHFIDIINCLGSGTTYDKWVKAYGCSFQKSWFPYK